MADLALELDLELLGPPGERRHLVAALECLSDELTAGAARGADDQDAGAVGLGHCSVH